MDGGAGSRLATVHQEASRQQVGPGCQLSKATPCDILPQQISTSHRFHNLPTSSPAGKEAYWGHFTGRCEAGCSVFKVLLRASVLSKFKHICRQPSVSMGSASVIGKIFLIYVCTEDVQTVLLVTVPRTMLTESICIAFTLC